MNTLVIYLHRFTYPMRKTIEDHIFSFEKFSNAQFYFVNAAFGLPSYLKKIPFDLVLYQTTFLSSLRWSNLSYEQWIQPFGSLRTISGLKAILPQDEFLCTDRVCRFINDFNIDKVFSVSPESEWKKIYAGIDPNKVSFHPVLTGYLNDELVDKIQKLKDEIPERDLDICYRAWHAENWLGRHGLLKTQVADAFQKKASQYYLNTDISTDDRKTFLGMDWYRFLLRSKYTIGVEGGSSILDVDGTIRKKVNDYMAEHPHASFEEVERKCFPGQDGLLSLFALSPRHLEACMTKTCQILVEGEYNGILKPGVHYLEIKKDFSNLDDVLQSLGNENLRKQIVDRAYEDIVLSQNYSYKAFVHSVMNTCLGQTQREPKKTFWHRLNKIREKILWGRLRLEVLFWKGIKKCLPLSLIPLMRRLKNKYCIH